MGIENNQFKSKSEEYSTPLEIVNPLIEKFKLKLDVCATPNNAKCERHITKSMDALTMNWNLNFWMNPPFSRNLKKWVQRAYEQSQKHKVTGVLLLPVRSNTNWWHKYIIDTKTEVRFLKGEIKFNNLKRGLWLPFAIVIMKGATK